MPNDLTDSDGTMRTDLLARFLLALNEREGCPIAERMKTQAAEMKVPKVVKPMRKYARAGRWAA